MRRTVTLLVAMGAVAILSAAPFAATIHVPGDSANIQAGINGAVNGDTVLVADGIFTGEGNRDVDFGGKLIVVRSENGPEFTTIDCEGYGRAFYIHSGESEDLIIEGFTITNGLPPDAGGAIRCFGSSPTIARCIFVNNASLYGGAIYFNGNPNKVSSNGGSPTPTVVNCTFVENAALLGGAIYYQYNDMLVTLENCIFYANTSQEGGAPVSSGPGDEITATVTLICCDVYANVGGNWVGFIADQAGINGNFSYDPLFCDGGNGDYRIANISLCAPANNSCGVLIGALDVGCTVENRTWYITADGTGDAPTIQAGIDSAVSGDTILAADGIYTGEGNRDIDFGSKFVVVKSENGPEFTIIDCGGYGRAFYIHSGQSRELVIEGFTITNGLFAGAGGAIRCFGSSPTIARCVFVNNASDFGGAIYFNGNLSKTSYSSGSPMPKVVNCTFVGNSAWGGGAIYYQYNDMLVTLENCIFYANTSQGGGAPVSSGPDGEISATVTLICCDVYANVGGDWVDYIADQADINGNLSLDPLFCNTANSDFSLFVLSPCAPANNSCGVLIGALGVGCTGPKTIIDPDTMYAFQVYSIDTIMATIDFGNFVDGHTVNDIDPVTMQVNGTLSPMSWAILPSHPDFSGEVMEITFPIIDFILGYMPLWGTTIQEYAVSGRFNDSADFLVSGEVVMIGHKSGDVNADGAVNIADLTYMVDFLFGGGTEPPVMEAADLDHNGSVNIADLTALVRFLFGR